MIEQALFLPLVDTISLLLVHHLLPHGNRFQCSLFHMHFLDQRISDTTLTLLHNPHQRQNHPYTYLLIYSEHNHIPFLQLLDTISWLRHNLALHHYGRNNSYHLYRSTLHTPFPVSHLSTSPLGVSLRLHHA